MARIFLRRRGRSGGRLGGRRPSWCHDLPGNSRFVGSAQDGPHRDLENLLRRHAGHPFQKPFADYNRRAAEAASPPGRGWNPRRR